MPKIPKFSRIVGDKLAKNSGTKWLHPIKKWLHYKPGGAKWLHGLALNGYTLIRATQNGAGERI